MESRTYFDGKKKAYENIIAQLKDIDLYDEFIRRSREKWPEDF